MTKKCLFIGAPVDSGKNRQGCRLGPDAYRVAGLESSLKELGHDVRDLGDICLENDPRQYTKENGIFALKETIEWTEKLSDAAYKFAQEGLPIFLGGDHSLSLGSVCGMAHYAAKQNRPLFVLWLDAHSDFHTLQTTDSGNLHGTPVAYFSGREGFENFPRPKAIVPTQNICMLGLRSIDRPERLALKRRDIDVIDMRLIDEKGIVRPLLSFLERIKDQNGLLHVSLDVDFLEPAIAPAVGTTVPGGATFREGHLVMEILHESDLVSSLDLVELNPMLDHEGMTARLMIDLTASLFGRKIFDKNR